jgi:hypothetical protein
MKNQSIVGFAPGDPGWRGIEVESESADSYNRATNLPRARTERGKRRRRNLAGGGAISLLPGKE